MLSIGTLDAQSFKTKAKMVWQGCSLCAETNYSKLIFSSFFFLLVLFFFEFLLGYCLNKYLYFRLIDSANNIEISAMIFLSCNSLLYPHTTWCLVCSLFSTAEEIFMQWWLQLWTYGSILFVAVMSMPSTLPPRFRTKLKVEEISMKS